ncbi:succinate dehydrogenase assembly factor 2-B, mitochondrial-like [Watersipora subatra]|uniref:succinate dehydrogenase assembly factor 2-B, mitochondrial-like n=1 Tax=Watersipora subatra TaxID=2589382 RepID=UPI00355B504B
MDLIRRLPALRFTLLRLQPQVAAQTKNISKCTSLKQDTTYIEIPVYAARPGESLEQKKARLLYQSRKRGIKETDLVLSTFAHKYLHKLSEEELAEYDRLINVPSNDWDIYYWASGVVEAPPEFDGPIMRKLIAHTQNNERESRIQQPDLPVVSAS